MTTNNRRGVSKFKMFISLLVLVVLIAMGGFVYFGWQSADLSDVSGRKGIAIGFVNIEQKVKNALTNNSEVTLTEAEINQYIAKNLKMKQGGYLKDFATVKGVYVDLKPDIMEVIIEREIAQYEEDGSVKTDVIQPFRHTVSMKLKIFTEVNEGGTTTRKVEFPGGTIGKAPTPGMLVMAVKASFDQLAKHFKSETDLAYMEMTSITVGDGFIKLDPRAKSSVVTQ